MERKRNEIKVTWKESEFIILRKKFFIMSMVEHWKNLLRKVVEISSLQTFHFRLHGALSKVV